MNQYDPQFDRKNKCRSKQGPIFLAPVILPYILKSIWCFNIILTDYESVWPKPLRKNIVGHIDMYFMVQRVSFFILKCMLCINTILSNLSQYDPKFDFKINVGHNDLYFMVQ